ncbi:hypothetical protein JZ751_026005 [Albula glossodonta]|uniref:Uncharacterized protein n=1 Tax=Albula glossodonta TaxID=121402 RepID=A0A8T2MRK2_9TELE|nr:hypothetical protein JZ751_026005 [Albula glossodonta]
MLYIWQHKLHLTSWKYLLGRITAGLYIRQCTPVSSPSGTGGEGQERTCGLALRTLSETPIVSVSSETGGHTAFKKNDKLTCRWNITWATQTFSFFTVDSEDRQGEGVERPRSQSDEWLTVQATPLRQLDMEALDYDLDLRREASQRSREVAERQQDSTPSSSSPVVTPHSPQSNGSHYAAVCQNSEVLSDHHDDDE